MLLQNKILHPEGNQKPKWKKKVTFHKSNWNSNINGWSLSERVKSKIFLNGIAI